MNAPLEDVLRRELHDLAGEGRPLNLAQPALREAARIQVRRFTATVVAAVALVTVGAALTAVRGGHDRSLPPAVDNPTPRASATSAPAVTAPGPVRSAGPDQPVSADPGLPLDRRPAGAPAYQLSGGWSLYGAPTANGTLVYDRWAKQYREIPARRAVPAPTGWYVAYFGDDGRPVLYDVTLDRANRIYAAPPHAAQASVVDWSPDGGRFVYVGAGPAGPVAVEVNAGNGDVRTVPLRDDCPPHCDAFYFNAATVVAATVAGGTFSYDLASGRPVGEAGPGGSDGAHSASRGGREILLTPDGRSQVTRPRSSQVEGQSPCPQPLAYWVDDDKILCAGPAAFTVFTVAGKQVSRLPWLPPMQGTDPYAITLYDR